MAGTRFLTLLLIALMLLLNCTAKHDSPIKLYGPGGRGIAAHTQADRASITACLMELADVDSSSSLGLLELKLVFKTGHYLTATEKLLSNLNEDIIMKRCDTDANNIISFDELMEPTCLNTAQLQAVATYICSRAKHEDIGFSEYRERFLAAKELLSHGNVLQAIGSESKEYLDAKLNPHAGRYKRFERPTDNTDIITGNIGIEYIIAFFYLLATILFIFVLTKLVFLV